MAETHMRALERHEIRLLHIHSTQSEIVDCTLKIVKLDEVRQSYVALSWCWSYGDTRTAAIRVNGEEFRTQANVVEMLRATSMTGLPDEGFFWLDTICIDQANPVEVEAQVKLQGEVYRRAKNVYVWMGADAYGSEMIMSLLQYLRAQNRTSQMLARLTIYGITRETLHSLEQLTQPNASSSRRNIPMGLEDADHPFWQAWIRFAARPWFGRQWIFQEFILCPSTFILCGDQWVDWQGLRVWTTNLIQPDGRTLLPLHRFERFVHLYRRISTLMDERSRRQHQDAPLGTPLGDLLKTMATRDVEATRPHDYIYGLLGLIPETQRQAIAVDYDADLGSVFADAMRVACFDVMPIRQAAEVWSMHEMQDDMGMQLADGFCSWCPRFDRHLSVRAGGLPPSYGIASADADLQSIARARSGPAPGCVQLDVIVLDTIEAVAVTPFEGDVEGEGLEFARQMMQKQIGPWMEQNIGLWQRSSNEQIASGTFLGDFFGKPQYQTFDSSQKMRLYQRLQSFASIGHGKVAEQDMLSALRQAVGDDQDEQRQLLGVMSFLRDHARSTYCLTASGQYGRCISQPVRAGDVVCLVPGSPWLHLFRKRGESRDGRQRIAIGWFTRWSFERMQHTAVDLQTLEVW